MRSAIRLFGRIAVLMLAALWLCQTPLWAAIYKWKDDEGKTHFTDDKSKIPLKYRNQLEKFKGVNEPKPKAAPGESTESGEEAAAKEEAPAGAGVEGQEAPKAPQKSKYNEEQIALLKQIKSYMVQSWAAKTKLIKHIEPTKLNGKYYVASQRKFAPQKKAIIKQIGGSEIPSLKNVKSFLKKSSNNDIRLEAKELPFMEKVQEIKSILETELPVQEDLINQLKKDIGEEEEPAAGKSSEKDSTSSTKVAHQKKSPPAEPKEELVDIMDLVEN